MLRDDSEKPTTGQQMAVILDARCHYRVACIVAPLTSRTNVCGISKDIHQFAFAFVAKLAT